MDRVALVTGGGGGIGRAISVALARSGFVVAVNDVDSITAAETVGAVAGVGGRAEAFEADVADAAAVDAMIARIVSKMGGLHVLVSNAGRPGRFSLLVDAVDDVWHRTRSVHLDGAFYCMRAAARRMVGERWGRIIAISSLAGLRGTVGSADYASAKAGLIALALTAAKELGEYGVTSNVVAPGMVATPVNKRLAEEGSAFIESAVRGSPNARLTTPDEVAALVAFLASDAAGAVNGQIIAADGGAGSTLTTDLFMRSFLEPRSAFLGGRGPGGKRKDG